MQFATSLSAHLFPELESALAKTRRMLENLPETQGEFRSHDKSRSLASLAGHTVDLISFIEMVLTRPEFDFGTQHRTPLLMHSRQQLLDECDRFTAKPTVALQSTSDGNFQTEFRLMCNGHTVSSGSRYAACRVNALDHHIHHRAQPAFTYAF